jgi:hypothetical protein
MQNVYPKHDQNHEASSLFDTGEAKASNISTVQMLRYKKKSRTASF